MRKITALFINELLKISQKTSVLVMVAIMVFGVVGLCGFIKREEKSMFGYAADVPNGAWVTEQMTEQVANFQDQIKKLETAMATAGEAEKPVMAEELAGMRDQLAIYQLAIANDIPLMYGSDYRSQALRNITTLKASLRALQRIDPVSRTEAVKKAIADSQALIVRYEALAGKQDFRDYLNIKNDEIKADASLDDAEKQIYLESNELWYQYDPTGGVSGQVALTGVSSTLSRIADLKIALLNNADPESGSIAQPLTADRRQAVVNDLAVLVYRLEHGLPADTDSQMPQEFAVRGMFGFGVFMIVLLMLILAGSSVSQEISTGSIKSLIISPTRRWKIFTAKALSLVSVGLAACLLLYVIAMLANGGFFGFTTSAPYVYAVNGVAHALNFYAFKLAGLLVSFIDVLVYLTLAFMLSVITRNTAAAVGISVAVYFGGSIANTFLAAFVKGEWLKFVPFNNLGLAKVFFPFDTFAESANIFGGAVTSGSRPSLLFSLIYLAVLLLCLGYTALDSFNRRDIK